MIAQKNSTLIAFPGAQANSPVFHRGCKRYLSAGAAAVEVWWGSVVLSEQPPACAGHPRIVRIRLGIGSCSPYG